MTELSTFEKIKNIENEFPIPTPSESIEVGSYDAATGEFVGLMTFIQLPEPPNFDKPIKMVPKKTIDAVDAIVTFEIKNNDGSVKVTANGKSLIASATSDRISINVGKSDLVTWKIHSDNGEIFDKLNINRPPIIGLGAFTIPALPVAIVYEPPADNRSKNTASYAVTKSIGSSATLSWGKSTDSTKGHVEGNMAKVSDLSSKAKKLGGLLKKVPVPKLQEVGKGLEKASKVLDFALGTDKQTQTIGESVTNKSTIALTDLVKTGFSTGQNDGGPGIGDRIIFLVNAQLVWLVDGGEVFLSLINFDHIGTRAVQTLRNPLEDEPLDEETREALLGLDPFVEGGRQASLPASRFVPSKVYQVNGGPIFETLEHTVTKNDHQEISDFSVTTQNLEKGFLAHIGLDVGVTESKTIKTTIIHSNVTETTETEKAEVSFELHAEIGELYAVEVYFDRIFGTFAFKQVPLLPSPVIAGAVNDSAGKPMVNEMVVLDTSGVEYVTKTDNSGNFAFHSVNIQPGKALLRIANKLHNVELDLATVLTEPIFV